MAILNNTAKDVWLGDKTEIDFVIGKMEEGEEQILCAKNISIWQTYSNFWRPALDKGKKCWDYVVGNILTDKEKRDLTNKDKLIIQIPELVPKINAIIGMQIKQARPGLVVAKSGDNAPDATVADTILKVTERESEASIEYSDTFKDSMVTSFPCFVSFEKSTDWTKDKSIDIYHEPWDSVLPDPGFKRYDLSDCEDIIRMRVMTERQMINKWPNRKEAIQKGMSKITKDNFGASFYNSDSRNLIFNTIQSGIEMFDRMGLNYIIERQFFVKKKQNIYVSKYSEQPEFLPENWDKQQISEWQQNHPDYQAVPMEVDLLWITTCTNTGILLENNAHWYQEGDFAMEMLVPQFYNNKPVGMVEFMIDNLKLGAFADIEYIHSVRLANDNLMVIKDGALVNAADAASEKARAGGMLVRTTESEPGDIEFPINRREQAGYADLKNMTLETSNRIGVSPSFEGNVATSQESGKAVEARARQTENRYSPYMNNMNAFIIRCRKKILKMIPYVFSEEHVFRYMDEGTKEQKEIAVNVPEEYNWNGDVVKFYNNLSGAKYDYIPTFGDDSISGKEQELNSFIEIMRNAMPSLPPESWPLFLTSVPNRLANELGQKLLEQQQQQAESGPQADPMRKSLTISGEDLLYNPLVQMILQKEGVLPEQLPPMPIKQPASNMAVQAQPQPQGIPA
jgi:hypothetical protein